MARKIISLRYLFQYTIWHPFYYHLIPNTCLIKFVQHRAFPHKRKSCLRKKILNKQILKYITVKFVPCKTGQNRLTKQNRNKLDNQLLQKLWPARNWTEISLPERQKLFFVAKIWDSKILKRLRINPENWRWNPLAS